MVRSKRDGKETNKSKEEGIIAVAITDTFSDLDFIVKALEFASRDGKKSMSNEAFYSGLLPLSKSNESRDIGVKRSREPSLLAYEGRSRVPEGKEATKLFLHRVTNSQLGMSFEDGRKLLCSML